MSHEIREILLSSNWSQKYRFRLGNTGKSKNDALWRYRWNIDDVILIDDIISDVIISYGTYEMWRIQIILIWLLIDQWIDKVWASKFLTNQIQEKIHVTYM